MAFGSLKDLYLDELRDLYDAERQVMNAMPKMIKAASSPDVRQAFEHHFDQTKMQIERLDLIFKHLGQKPTGKHCHGMEGVLKEADEIISHGGAPDVCDAALIASAQRVEHYEIASYGSARTFADRLDDGYAADLLQKTLDEEGRTDKLLTGLAEGGINQQAAAGKEIHGSNLDYISFSEYAGDRPDFADVRMFGAGGDDLGKVDGFILDRNSGRPFYVVVDAGNWFTGKRYLLPVGKARFESNNRRMVVDLDKDTVKKYPKFEENWFTYDENRRREYESRLFTAYGASYQPGTSGLDYGTMPEFREPDWWRSGDFGVFHETHRRQYDRQRPGSERVAAHEARTEGEPRADVDRSESERSGTFSEGRSTIDEPRRNDRDPNKRPL